MTVYMIDSKTTKYLRHLSVYLDNVTTFLTKVAVRVKQQGKEQPRDESIEQIALLRCSEREKILNKEEVWILQKQDVAK